MKRILTTTLFLLVLLVSFHSCYYDNEAYLYGSEVTCTDTTSTYTTRLAPILNSNCVSCHGAGEFPDLSSFTDVNTLKEEIVCRVVEGNSCSTGAQMPPSAGMSVCDVQAFSLWQQNGYQE